MLAQVASIVGYLDDFLLVGTFEEVQEFMSLLPELAVVLGFEVNSDKTKLEDLLGVLAFYGQVAHSGVSLPPCPIEWCDFVLTGALNTETSYSTGVQSFVSFYIPGRSRGCPENMLPAAADVLAGAVATRRKCSGWRPASWRDPWLPGEHAPGGGRRLGRRSGYSENMLPAAAGVLAEAVATRRTCSQRRPASWQEQWLPANMLKAAAGAVATRENMPAKAAGRASWQDQWLPRTCSRAAGGVLARAVATRRTCSRRRPASWQEQWLPGEHAQGGGRRLGRSSGYPKNMLPAGDDVLVKWIMFMVTGRLVKPSTPKKYT
ncbi:hypothetical protein CYMTET_21297 [Cymbomonas tetramitiformis]|uniref:Uncharacterized protein n=1 Tax=Cymbomonas tetramitiformis TaxID=36881 RepID=A0AAE0G2N2_9CHLO|nr:hypothetical protein CYMTET_21297 [Cymbomonas tetramitiformis]